MNKRIIALLPSYWWPSAVVIVPTCGHRHVRPGAWVASSVALGDKWDCCFCDE